MRTSRTVGRRTRRNGRRRRRNRRREEEEDREVEKLFNGISHKMAKSSIPNAVLKLLPFVDLSAILDKLYVYIQSSLLIFSFSISRRY